MWPPRLVTFRNAVDLRGYGHEYSGHEVGVVEDGLEEGYPQELPRILAIRRERGQHAYDYPDW